MKKRFAPKSKVVLSLVITTFLIIFGTNVVSADGPTWSDKDSWDVPDVGYNSAPAFADLDNDGDYDLLVGTYEGVSYAYENAGTTSNPTWTEKSEWNTPDVGLDSAPAFADLDNDGDYDLLIGEKYGNSFGYENTGTVSSPTWTAKSAWDAPNVGMYASPAFADLDSDGDYDLLIGKDEGICLAYENTGTVSSPTWTKNSDWDAREDAFIIYASPAFADLDSDGDYDLLIGDYYGYSFAYKNTDITPPVPELSTLLLASIGLLTISLIITQKNKKKNK